MKMKDGREEAQKPQERIDFVPFVPLGGNCPNRSAAGLFGDASRGAIAPIFLPFAAVERRF